MICLNLEELSEALSANNIEELFIAGEIKEETLFLVNGLGDITKVPLLKFTKTGDIEPDFSKFSLIDYGQTIKFGSYEVSCEFINSLREEE